MVSFSLVSFLKMWLKSILLSCFNGFVYILCASLPNNEISVYVCVFVICGVGLSKYLNEINNRFFARDAIANSNFFVKFESISQLIYQSVRLYLSQILPNSKKKNFSLSLRFKAHFWQINLQRDRLLH